SRKYVTTCCDSAAGKIGQAGYLDAKLVQHRGYRIHRYRSADSRARQHDTERAKQCGGETRSGCYLPPSRQTLKEFDEILCRLTGAFLGFVDDIGKFLLKRITYLG